MQATPLSVHDIKSGCTSGDGTRQKADLAEDLIVDGETDGCVKRFCYLRDTLDGLDLAVTPRIKSGRIKFRELLPFLISRALLLELKDRVYISCARSSIISGSEPRFLLADVRLTFERQ